MLRLVVNMKRSADRWEAIKKQLEQLQISVRRVDAVDGKLLPDEEVKRLTSSVHYSMGRELERGEIGCFLSHRKCWQELVDSGEKYALVMEDDLLFSDRALKFMQSDDWIPAECDLIQLFVFRKQKKYLCERKEYDLKDGDRLWIPVFPAPVGTQAYIISRQAAEIALQKSDRFNLPVDEFLFVRSDVSSRFPCYRLNHAVVMDADVPSEIRKNKARTKTNFLMELKRFIERMERSIRKKLGVMTGRYVEHEFDFK